MVMIEDDNYCKTKDFIDVIRGQKFWRKKQYASNVMCVDENGYLYHAIYLYHD